MRSASCPNSQRVRPFQPLRIEDNPRSGQITGTAKSGFHLTLRRPAVKNFRNDARAFSFMTTTKKAKFSRILLKLSGEALGGDHGVGISPQAVHHMAEQIREVRELGVEVVVVVGGGNIFRGLSGSEHGIERATGDYMGMLATIINALALQDALEKTGSPTP